MEKIKSFYYVHRKMILLSLTTFFIILGIGLFVTINNIYKGEEKADEIIVEPIEILSMQENEVLPEIEKEENVFVNTIKVDVKGAVNNPGVYELIEGERVIDAINKAEGLREDAYTKYLNLSRIIKDQDVILVNTFSEIEEIKNKDNKKIVCENISNACITNNHLITSDITGETSKSDVANDNASIEESTISNDKSLVNINEANAEELMLLNGIGESKANAIISYRNAHGNFLVIDDIKNVSGIGEKAYEAIKEDITV